MITLHRRNFPYIAPSLLAADFARLADEIQMVEKAGAELLHIDVMDGHFVPNITIGPVVVEAIKRAATIPLDVHLMITNPDMYISAFKNAGADILTVHVETCTHLHRTIQSIHESGMAAGVSINPATLVSTLDEILPFVDLVLLMSVNPGFGGQKFIVESLRKISALRDTIQEGKYHALIEVDGGITKENAKDVFLSGADILVSGSAIFHSGDYASYIQAIRQQCEVPQQHVLPIFEE